MSSRLLFISDLHLDESRPAITSALLEFLDTHAGACQALYILGDLFEAWIGDDETTGLSQTVASALAGFRAAGSEIYLMHGNRDFLIGQDYCQRCAATLIHEPLVIDSAAGSLLLLHGDSLCIDDVEYMKFRASVRQPAWQQEFLARPLAERREFAAEARRRSQAATANKAESIMDVNAEEVYRQLAASGQATMIHGHTHRPAVHPLTLDPAIAGHSRGQRVVLGDWDARLWYAEVIDSEIRLESRPVAA